MREMDGNQPNASTAGTASPPARGRRLRSASTSLGAGNEPDKNHSMAQEFCTASAHAKSRFEATIDADGGRGRAWDGLAGAYQRPGRGSYIRSGVDSAPRI